MPKILRRNHPTAQLRHLRVQERAIRRADLTVARASWWRRFFCPIRRPSVKKSA